MNAITRVVEVQRLTFLPFVSLSRQGVSVMVMIILLLCSAFSIVYVKDLERRLFIGVQVQEQEKHKAIVEWNRLLLEQGAWAAQLRIQKMASDELGMVIPKAGDVVLVSEGL